MCAWKRQPQFGARAPALHEWFETDMGRAILAVEQRLLDRCLTDCFGYYLLQLSVDSDLDLYGDCRIQRCFKAGPVVPKPAQASASESKAAQECRAGFVRCDFEELPFESDSLDVIVVHHVLEFSANPHAVLRELYRVLVPEGRIILVGFNPWSPFGARMALGHLRSGSVWRNHLLSAPRMNDWLQLLGFETARTDYGFHRLPFHRTAPWPTLSRADTVWSRHWPFGGVYAITAIKQVAKFIPMKPLRLRVQPVLAPLSAKPSAAVGQRRNRRH